MPPAGMSFVRIDGQRIAGKVLTTTTPGGRHDGEENSRPYGV
jgi:hypothetical protein